MNRMDISAAKIIALAYFHRYGWIAAMMVCMGFWSAQMTYILCAGCIIHSIWSFVGYKCKWKHIYCSYQNAYHQKMTPHCVRWHQIKKSDAYGVPLIFFTLGLAGFILLILYR